MKRRGKHCSLPSPYNSVILSNAIVKNNYYYSIISSSGFNSCIHSLKSIRRRKLHFLFIIFTLPAVIFFHTIPLFIRHYFFLRLDRKTTGAILFLLSRPSPFVYYSFFFYEPPPGGHFLLYVFLSLIAAVMCLTCPDWLCSPPSRSVRLNS